jgi:hypothetical protein
MEKRGKDWLIVHEHLGAVADAGAERSGSRKPDGCGRIRSRECPSAVSRAPRAVRATSFARPQVIDAPLFGVRERDHGAAVGQQLEIDAIHRRGQVVETLRVRGHERRRRAQRWSIQMLSR